MIYIYIYIYKLLTNKQSYTLSLNKQSLIQGRCAGEEDCCTEERKCDVDEGNCKSDQDCKAGLMCGNGNCYNWWTKSWNKGDNCCFDPGISRILIVISYIY